MLPIACGLRPILIAAIAALLALAFLIAAVLRWRNEVDKKKWAMKDEKKTAVMKTAEAKA